jgi:hypothetical protein
MDHADWFALFLAALAVLAAYLVTALVFENMPHIEDEIAYVWQAEAIAGGKLTLPTPPEKHSFLVPFVVDYEGRRFGKYPLGWPIVLAGGVLLGVRSWVNPLLAGLSVWFTYRLGKRLFGGIVGILAAVLTLSSPFFLMNSGSLLSHPLGLVLSAVFALSWLDAWHPKDESTSPAWHPWIPTLAAALSLGLLILTRPLTAVAVCLPFIPHGVYLLLRRSWRDRLRLLIFALVVLMLGGLLFLWQYALTGDPLLNPYTLWWEYDKIGFGPGVGRAEGGHTLRQAWINTKFSLRVGEHDLYGWAGYSWIFLIPGLLVLFWRRHWRGLLIASVFPSMVIVYLAYWIGSHLFGPRYFFEALYSLTIVSAVGIAWLAGWPLAPEEPYRLRTGWRKTRPLSVFAVLIILIVMNLIFYVPMRVGGMHGLYEIEAARLKPFQTEGARNLAPAVFVVHPSIWMEYGALLDLQDPFLNTPFLFVISRGERADKAVGEAFPERGLFHYYPDEPYTFYEAPLPDRE